MRPTCLGFRNPKDRTPQFYVPTVTSDGRKLYDYTYRKPQPSSKGQKRPRSSSTFSGSQRFGHYQLEILIKRTSPTVGPGTYTAKRIEDRQALKPCAALMKKPVAGFHDAREGFVLSGSQLVYDPLYSDSVTQANRVKQFLNASISGIDSSHEQSSQFSVRKSKSRTSYKPSLQFYKTYSPTNNANHTVKQILTNQLSKGVAVNPLYTGVLENAFKAKKGSTGSEELSKTLKSSINQSFHDRSMSRVTNNGLASILDLISPDEEIDLKGQKKRVASAAKARKGSIGNIQGRKLKKHLSKRRWGSISSVQERKMQIKIKSQEQNEKEKRKEKKETNEIQQTMEGGGDQKIQNKQELEGEADE